MEAKKKKMDLFCHFHKLREIERISKESERVSFINS